MAHSLPSGSTVRVPCMLNSGHAVTLVRCSLSWESSVPWLVMASALSTNSILLVGGGRFPAPSCPTTSTSAQSCLPHPLLRQFERQREISFLMSWLLRFLSSVCLSSLLLSSFSTHHKGNLTLKPQRLVNVIIPREKCFSMGDTVLTVAEGPSTTI